MTENGKKIVLHKKAPIIDLMKTYRTTQCKPMWMHFRSHSHRHTDTHTHTHSSLCLRRRTLTKFQSVCRRCRRIGLRAFQRLITRRVCCSGKGGQAMPERFGRNARLFNSMHKQRRRTYTTHTTTTKTPKRPLW